MPNRLDGRAAMIGLAPAGAQARLDEVGDGEGDPWAHRCRFETGGVRQPFGQRAKRLGGVGDRFLGRWPARDVEGKLRSQLHERRDDAPDLGERRPVRAQSVLDRGRRPGQGLQLERMLKLGRIGEVAVERRAAHVRRRRNGSHRARFPRSQEVGRGGQDRRAIAPRHGSSAARSGWSVCGGAFVAQAMVASPNFPGSVATVHGSRTLRRLPIRTVYR